MLEAAPANSTEETLVIRPSTINSSLSIRDVKDGDSDHAPVEQGAGHEVDRNDARFKFLEKPRRDARRDISRILAKPLAVLR